MSQAFPQLPEQNSPNLVNALWRRKALLVFFAVLGVAIAYLYHRRQPPSFVTTGRVLVSVDDPASRDPTVVMSGGQQYFGGIQSHVPAEVERVIMTSTPVLRQVVDKGRLDHLQDFQATDWQAGVQRIRNNLVIQQLTGSTPSSLVLDLRYNSEEPKEAEVVLPAVVEGYQEFLESSQVGAGERVMQKIQEASDVIRQQLEPLEQQYRDFRKDSPLLFGQNGQAENPYREMMTRVHSQMVDMTVEKTKLRGEIRSLENALKSDSGDDKLLAIVARSQNSLSVGRNPPTKDSEANAPAAQTVAKADVDQDFVLVEEIHQKKLELEQTLTPLTVKQRNLADQFGAGHPSVRSLTNEITMNREMLEKLVESEVELQTAIRKRQAQVLLQSKTETIEQTTKSPRELAQLQLSVLMETLSSQSQQETELKGLFDQHRKLASMLSQIEADDAEYRRRIERLQELYVGITARLEELKLFSGDGPQRVVKVLEMSDKASVIRPNLARNLGAGGVLGLMVGMGLGLLFELTNRTFYTPEEVAQSLHLPVLTHVPTILLSRREASRMTDSPLAPMVVSHHLPKSRYAESYRGIRTHILHHFKGELHRVVQITSPQPSDGKSVSSSNIAVSFAQAGRKVCLVDADFRRPTIHKLFGVSGTKGVADVIEGNAELKEVIRGTPVTNLNILPVGTRPQNPSELLLSREFADIIAWLRDNYDYVIIDSAPLLAVTDPTNIAPLADAVIMTFRLRRDIRPAAQRALKVLESIGVTPIGVVVNDVGDEYGSNRFGYKYNDGYSYGYRYGLYGSRFGKDYYGRESRSVASVDQVNGASSLNGSARNGRIKEASKAETRT